MKKLLNLLVILFFLTTSLSMAQFDVTVEKIFSTDEEVTVLLNPHTWAARGASVPTTFFFGLYKLKDPYGYLMGLDQEVTPEPDQVLAQSERVHFQQQDINTNEYTIKIPLGKWQQGAYLLETVSMGSYAYSLILVTDYELVNWWNGTELLTAVVGKQDGKAQKGFATYIPAIAKEPLVTRDGLFAYWSSLQSGLAERSLLVLARDEEGHMAFSKNYLGVYRQMSSTFKIYLTSSRPAYRPNQWFHFKGLARKATGSQYTVVTDSLSVQISGPNGEAIFTKKIKPDQHGAFADSVWLAEEMPLGTYTVTAQVMKGQGNDRNFWWMKEGQLTFELQAYKKPIFEAQLSTPKNRYVAGDQVPFQVNASYFFGGAVKNAGISYRIMREANVTYYGWGYPRFDWTTDGVLEIVDSGEGTLDENGAFKVMVNTAVNNNDRREYRYTLYTDITDVSGHTVSTSHEVAVAYAMLSMQLTSQQYYARPGNSVKFQVTARDLEAQPVSTPFSYQVFHWKEGTPQKISEQTGLQTDRQGKQEFSYTFQQAGSYYLETQALDARGRLVAATAYLYVFQPGGYWWFEDGQDKDLTVMTEQTEYAPGDTVKIVAVLPQGPDAFFIASNRTLLNYRVLQGQQAVDAWVPQEITFVIPPDAWGSHQLMVATFYEGDLLVKSIPLTVKPKVQLLNVGVTFDKPVYQPGESALATISVRDHAGRPVQGALVWAATADESLLTLYPDRQTPINTFFYPLQEEKEGVMTTGSFSQYEGSVKGSIAWISDFMQKYQPGRSFLLRKNQWYALAFERMENAQILEGYVISHETGQPLAGATVRFLNARATTNAMGYYRLAVSSTGANGTLRASFKGKATTIKEFPVLENASVRCHIAISRSDNREEIFVDEIAVDDIEVSLDMEAWDGEDIPPTEQVAPARRSMLLAERNEMVMGGMKPKSIEPSAPVTLRKDFRDDMAWAPQLFTNSQGVATLPMTVPDNLTTWRTTAWVATHETRVGSTMGKFMANKPLMVRMETPRFLTLGDEAVIATTLYNYQEQATRVRVSLDAKGATVTGTVRTVQLAPGQDSRIDWRVKATSVNGATLTVTALGPTASDAEAVTLPINPKGLEMVTAQSAYLRDTQTQSLVYELPAHANASQAELEISMAPSVTAALLASMDQLIGYPYGCVEQTMSRFLPTLIVSNTLKNLGSSYTSNISEAELTKMIAKGVRRLSELQHGDGGWGWWEKDATHPFMTAYVVSGLQLCQQSGYPVSQLLLDKGKQSVLAQLSRSKEQKLDATTHAFLMLTAVQAGLGNKVWPAQQPDAKQWDAYTLALWLQSAVLHGDSQFAAVLMERLRETAVESGNFTWWGGQSFYYNWTEDQVETTAHVVRAISLLNPEDPMLPKAVQWLMSKRRGSAWHNTRQTAFTIYGLQDMIRQELEPNLTVSAYVNGKLADTYTISPADVFQKDKRLVVKGRTFTASRLQGDTPPSLTNGQNTVRIEVKGTGRLYVNSRLTWFSEEVNDQTPKGSGFVLERTYFSLHQKKLPNGTWVYEKQPLAAETIKPGMEILVKTRVIADQAREYVMIEDPKPAGCEFIENRAAYLIEGEEGYIPDVIKPTPRFYLAPLSWFTHEEYRDDRYTLTVTNLNKGEYQYSYLLRAQVAGQYEVNPAVVQLMYYPEVRGAGKPFNLQIRP
jgi:uncharacterized protein YfaS (alpha-2-macroglobulin family)